MEREYRCRIRGDVNARTIARLIEGVRVDGAKMAFDKVKQERSRGSHRWFTVVLREGKYREVRRLWQAVGCEVSRLLRIRYGPVTLPRGLRPGTYMELSGHHKAQLLHTVKQKPEAKPVKTTLSPARQLAGKKR